MLFFTLSNDPVPITTTVECNTPMYFARWLTDESITNVELLANSISSEEELVKNDLPAAGWTPGEPQARANKGLTLFRTTCSRSLLTTRV